MPSKRYQHWRNDPTPGRTMFVTATCLDFAHLFARPEMKTAMVRQLATQCRSSKATLHAFAVMSHHIHVLVTPPAGRSASWVVQRIKSESASVLLPMLTNAERAQLSQQEGLSQRRFWMRSFRGLAVISRQVFNQKVEYIHENPVRAGLACDPSEYKWSSAWSGFECQWDCEADNSLLVLKSIRAL